MKRCFCMALALALMGTPVLSAAGAEEAEIISEYVEPEVAPAQSESDTGLTVELEGAAPEQIYYEEEITEEAPAETPIPTDYVRVLTDGADLSADPEGASLLATLSAGSVALSLEAGPRTRIALYTGRGIVEGYVDAGSLAALDGAETGAYLDAAAAGAVVALYQDDLSRPLAMVDCAFADAATEPQTPEEAAPAVEEAQTEEAAPAVEEAQTEEAAPAVEEAQTGEAAPAVEEEQTGEAAPAVDEMQQEALEESEAQGAELETAIMAEGAEETAGDAETPAVPMAATGLQLSAESISMGVKETYKGLTATALPEGSELPAVTWRSDNTKVVQVNADTGELTGVKTGTATVYASIEGGEEVSCKVTVKSAPGKITLSPKTMTLGIGMTGQLKATFPKKTASATLNCSSSNTGVATVDARGVITAVGAGKATITVNTFNGKKAKCKVTVLPEPAAVVFASQSVSLAQSQKVSLSAEALTADGTATEAAITYSIDPNSQDSGCITLNAATGEITGVRRGRAIVIAATGNGILATCEVVVAAAPKSLTLSASSLTIGVKESCKRLTAQTEAPAGESECASAVAWTSSNSKVVKVDASTGELLGVKAGSATITARTVNGLTKKCKVTVKKAPGKISSLKPAKGSLNVGQTGQYKVSLPSGTGGTVTFESSNTAVATVTNTGLVTAVGPGSVTITATTYNGKRKTASLTVNGTAVKPAQDDDDDTESSDVTEYKASPADAEKIEYVISVAQSKLGKPYVYGSFGPNSFDCSGFTTYCFRQVNIELKHSAYTQGYDSSKTKVAMSDLRRGDLVYFDTVSDSDQSDHAGIYMGSGKFIHASSSAGKVIISTLASGYYNKAFSWGRRVFD